MSARRTQDEITVSIRMYRLGLGDSFFLRFSEGKHTRSVLIDCGVVGRSDAAEAVQRVATDVADVTGGRLDVLVATHGHRDHASGFWDAAEIFAKLDIGQVWLPVGEDTGEAARLEREARTKRLRRLRKVAAERADAPAAQGLSGLLGLFEECDGKEGEEGATTTDLLAPLRSGPWPVRYLDVREPPRMLADLVGVRVYVLGPADGGSARGALDAGDAFLNAALSPDEDEEWNELIERNHPFESTHRTRVTPGYEGPSFDPAEHSDFFRRYYAADDAWRTIDHDWLGVARGLAVALDAHADSQSLALAFELTGSGQVLLFPGDAATWNRWSALSWEVGGGPGERPRRVTGAELLRRVRVLKVPHHCSAAAVRGALDRIEGRDLMALVTGGAEAAEALRWNLPHPPSLQKLMQKTRGRVLLSDPDKAEQNGSDGAGRHLTEPERRAFRRSVKRTDLYVELTLRPGG